MKIIYFKPLDKILQNCIKKYFPELLNKNIEICFTFKKNDFGAGKSGNKIILFLPEIEINFKSPGIILLIAHELCHFINLHNPGKEFRARMPKNYCQIWEDLEKMGEISCDRGRGNSRITERIN